VIGIRIDQQCSEGEDQIYLYNDGRMVGNHYCSLFIWNGARLCSWY